jgi:outer membrane protein OmpU
MNNFRKIGLTALAGSLVASSFAVAGDLGVTGSAEMKVTNHSQTSTGKTIAMGNSVNFAGSGETDGGLTVNVSFELDQGAGDGTGPFDSHQVSVGSDTLGTLAVHGHGGSNAAASRDTSAAGDLWDNTLGITTASGGAGKTPQAGASGNGLVVYSLPSLADGVAISASYATAGENNEGSSAFGTTITSIEGLTINLGISENAGTIGVSQEQTFMGAAYVYGPITVGVSHNDWDHTTSSSDQETTSFGISYTLTDSISVSYGQETIDNNTDAADVEVDGITASYTSGGMTVSAKNIKADNVDGSSTSANNNNEMWQLSASFAF